MIIFKREQRTYTQEQLLEQYNKKELLENQLQGIVEKRNKIYEQYLSSIDSEYNDIKNELEDLKEIDYVYDGKPIQNRYKEHSGHYIIEIQSTHKRTANFYDENYGFYYNNGNIVYKFDDIQSFKKYSNEWIVNGKLPDDYKYDYYSNPGDEYFWTSICSIHQIFDENCNMCLKGLWRNKKDADESHKLYEENPERWRELANNPNSESRKFLDRILT